MENTLKSNHELFLDCNWKYEPSLADYGCYTTMMINLKKHSVLMLKKENIDGSNLFELLGKVASMRLQADSLNEPFLPYLEVYQTGQCTIKPEHFSVEELVVLGEILNAIDEPCLKARLADLLWLTGSPRNLEYAEIAIDLYTVGGVNEITWYLNGKALFERAIRLCLQIRDYERLNIIKEKLLNSFSFEYINSQFMQLSIAELMHDLKIDKDNREVIASTLLDTGYVLLTENKNFLAAESYFNLASKKYYQFSNNQKYVECLIAMAQSVEMEADSRSVQNNMVANGFYEKAIQIYRKIPKKYRDENDIDSRISELRKKITITGQSALEEMVTFESGKIDISEHVQNAIDFVSNKESIENSLVYFAKISTGPNYKKLVECAKTILLGGDLSCIFGARYISNDGRIIAKTPAMNWIDDSDPKNEVALLSKTHELFKIRVDLLVNMLILPALGQLWKEYRITKDLMIALCHLSPLVQEDRIYLLGNALWLGFEADFSSAIHLICPQLEHIVRTLLKDEKVETSNLDKDGIENENGLSTLMGLPKVEDIFGKSLSFEIKSIFTESIGFNLRNNVAHGILDDNTSASVEAVYAWWLTLRLVISSIIDESIKRD